MSDLFQQVGENGKERIRGGNEVLALEGAACCPPCPPSTTADCYQISGYSNGDLHCSNCVPQTGGLVFDGKFERTGDCTWDFPNPDDFDIEIGGCLHGGLLRLFWDMTRCGWVIQIDVDLVSLGTQSLWYGFKAASADDPAMELPVGDYMRESGCDTSPSVLTIVEC